MTPGALSPAIQTLFADLVQLVKTAPVAGSVYRRALEATDDFYAKLPVGATRLDSFVGKAGGPQAEARAASLQAGATWTPSPHR